MDQPIEIENEIHLLDAKQVKIRRNSSGELEVELPDRSVYSPVTPVRALPLSHPDQFIAFLDEDKNELGMIEDIGRLRKADRRMLKEELEKCYFMPKITKIHSIVGRFGISRWDVNTDRGPVQFDLRTRSDVQPFDDGRVLIKDIDGVRYEIPNYHRLDLNSAALVETQI